MPLGAPLAQRLAFYVSIVFYAAHAANLLKIHRSSQEATRVRGETLHGQLVQNGTEEWRGRIPRQLILTGKYGSSKEWPHDVRTNMKKTLAQNPDLKVRWFNDVDCANYLEAHPELGLNQAFELERRGSYRGDICRTAVLAREGGFYQDLDVELQVPFGTLVDDSTSFMSVYSESGGILNALFATEANGSVVRHTLEELKRWYTVPGARDGNWMGPETMLRGMKDVNAKNCPDVKIDNTRSSLQWTCGDDEFRMYEERKLHDCRIDNLQSPGCTLLRAGSYFDGLKFALFQPGKPDTVIGWPRYENCRNFGCSIGGWDVN